MQFMDDENQFDTATGVVTGIVRHKKSKALIFKYWNHQVHDVKPVDESDFEFINVDQSATVNGRNINLQQNELQQPW